MNKKLGITLLVVTVASAAMSILALIMLKRHANVLKSFINNDHGYGNEEIDKKEEDEYIDW